MAVLFLQLITNLAIDYSISQSNFNWFAINKNSSVMKLLIPIGLLCIAVTVISCKKDNDSFSWNKELKGSAWAGEFKYTSGAYRGAQPFSIVMADGTLTWYQGSGSHSGRWFVEGDKIIITFTDSSKISATLSKGSWSNFTDITVNGFVIQYLSRSFVPDPNQLNGTEWAGKYSSADLTIDFTARQKVAYSFPTSSFIAPYIVYGAGIKHSRTFPSIGGTGTVVINSYGVFTNDTTIKGAELILTPPAVNPEYLLWNGKKQ
jgi:hypothetical protein